MPPARLNARLLLRPPLSRQFTPISSHPARQPTRSSQPRPSFSPTWPGRSSRALSTSAPAMPASQACSRTRHHTPERSTSRCCAATRELEGRRGRAHGRPVRLTQPHSLSPRAHLHPGPASRTARHPRAPSCFPNPAFREPHQQAAGGGDDPQRHELLPAVAARHGRDGRVAAQHRGPSRQALHRAQPRPHAARHAAQVGQQAAQLVAHRAQGAGPGLRRGARVRWHVPVRGWGAGGVCGAGNAAHRTGVEALALLAGGGGGASSGSSRPLCSTSTAAARRVVSPSPAARSTAGRLPPTPCLGVRERAAPTQGHAGGLAHGLTRHFHKQKPARIACAWCAGFPTCR
jgi:hypothetical protein